MQKLCAHPGCNRPRTGHTQYCAHCRRRGDRAYKAQRDPDNGFYSSDPWRNFRAAFLSEHPTCNRCGGIASMVHHITPRSEAPELAMDASNCEALCKHCHGEHHSTEQTSFVKPKRPNHITLICGPVGSGTLEYARTHKRYGDIIIDYSSIVSALTSEPLYASAHMSNSLGHLVRNVLIERLAEQCDGMTAWVTARLPDADERQRLAEQLKASLVVLAAEPRECEKRLRLDPVRSKQLYQWLPLVHSWWEEYTPTVTREEEHADVIEV